MSKIILETEKKFTLSNYMPGVTYRCHVTVKIIHYQQQDDEYYDLTYTYQFDENQIEGIKNPAHPFYQTASPVDGVTVYKNEMTTPMVKYLQLDDTELERHTGSITTCAYRRKIMNMLNSLWN